MVSNATIWTVLAISALTSVGVSASRVVDPDVHEIRVRLDGRSIRALCTSGPRQVLILTDDGASIDAWRPVLQRLDGRVGACAFDRPTVGGAQDSSAVRGWFELVDELRRVGAALGFKDGYVLVGHGVGGMYARLYAADRPGDVAGLLLVDPTHEDLPAKMKVGMPETEFDRWIAARSTPNRDGILESELDERARRARLPDIPVTVVTAMLRRSGPGWDERFLVEAGRQAHASLLTGVAVARHVPATRSGHDVEVTQPDRIVEELLRLLGASGR